MSTRSRCTVCVAAGADPELDREIVRGLASTEVARRWSVSRHAVDRHRSADRGHIHEDTRAEVWTEQRAHVVVRPGDVVSRLVDLAADAAAVRQRAARAGQDRIVLAAIESERACLADLVTRTGITTQAALEELAEANATVSAVITLARENPSILGQLVAVLRQQGAPADLIAAVDLAASRAEQRHLQLVPTPTQEISR